MKNRNIVKKASNILLISMVAGNLYAQQENEPIKRPNILFIVVDDLRPELGCYGKEHILSPNIDKLAGSGITFTRSYCNVPVCGASRASMLSGIRPNRSRFLDYDCFQDKDVPGVVSLPMHFKNKGYHTISMGKVYHQPTDGQGSWSEGPWAAKDDYVAPGSREQLVPSPSGKGVRGPAFEGPDVPDHVYKDGMLANEAISRLHELKSSKQPFFFALGFSKPHLPFNAPKKYWDLYDFNEIKLPENMNRPKDAPGHCMHNYSELRNYVDVPDQGAMDESYMRQLIHGYYASVSYVDAQIGKVLSELEKTGMSDNTIVVLLGDHGWFLGDHSLWCKHSILEKGLRAPLIVKAPDHFVKNSKSDALVEFVDLYPSLCDLAGLEKPFHLQGNSFVPLAENLEQTGKDAIFCRWMGGETIVTQTHTYTEWFSDQTGEVTANMLFNLVEDPDETVNISMHKNNERLVQELSSKLKTHIANRDKLVIPSADHSNHWSFKKK